MIRSVRTPPPLVAVAHAVNSEGWLQAGELGLALVQSAVTGLEREVELHVHGKESGITGAPGRALAVLPETAEDPGPAGP